MSLGERPYICVVSGCRQKFACRKSLKLHTQKHGDQDILNTVERPFTCAVTGCSKKYASRKSLQVHVKKHGDHDPLSTVSIHSVLYIIDLSLVKHCFELGMGW